MRDGKIEEAHCLMQEMENMGLKSYPESFNLCYIRTFRRKLENVSYTFERKFLLIFSLNSQNLYSNFGSDNYVGLLAVAPALPNNVIGMT
ncbi:hypothetical protein SDJN03_23482, partial [Cucurbita argyrosperma subsp. sororia]